MKETKLSELIQQLAHGDITPEDHEQLQRALKASADARSLLREQLDLESALRTWASTSAAGNDSPAVARPTRREKQRSNQFWLAVAAVLAASLLACVFTWQIWHSQRQTDRSDLVSGAGERIEDLVFVGVIGAQKNARWRSETGPSGSRFSQQALLLEEGVAELKFDSGVNVLLEGPCELNVTASNSARLVAGKVVIQVTELSDGFRLDTPCAAITDEGTEYAVSLDSDATEVHVFDGVVRWQPENSGEERPSDRIKAGEARRFTRSQPSHGARIPLEKRLFVRRIEAGLQGQAGGSLLAYDGFENLAGRMHRGRSGFGWNGGWRSSRFAPRDDVAIVDAPAGIVFGADRKGRRLLQFKGAKTMWRELESSLPLDGQRAYYVSFLLRSNASADSESGGAGKFFELSLLGASERRRTPAAFAFGVNSNQQPYLKCLGAITTAAVKIESGAVYLCAGKILISPAGVFTSLRLFRNGEVIHPKDPSEWTVSATGRPSGLPVTTVCLRTGSNAQYEIDELRVGKDWASVSSADVAGQISDSVNSAILPP